jgi:hypothetical protein
MMGSNIVACLLTNSRCAGSQQMHIALTGRVALDEYELAGAAAWTRLGRRGRLVLALFVWDVIARIITGGKFCQWFLRTVSQQLPAACQTRLAFSLGHEARITDTPIMGRQDVERKPPDELHGRIWGQSAVRR